VTSTGTTRPLADQPAGTGGTQPPEVRVDPTTVPARRRRWLVPGLVALGWLVNVGWRLWLAVPLDKPVVLGDESRYMIFARVLAGGPGGYGGDTEATRRVGYALLISPTYWFSSDPFAVYRLVQALNAVVNAGTFPLAYLFARRILGTDRRWSTGIALVAASLPAVAFFSPFALPNAVLTPLLLGWLLTLHGWMSGGAPRRRLYAAAGSGALIGFMYVVHVRVLLLLSVYAVAVLGLLVARRVKLREAAVSALATGLALTLHPLLKGILAGRVITGGTEPETRMMSAFTTVDGFLRTVSDAFGQLWYLCVGTWGLAAVGLVLTGYQLARRNDRDWSRAVTLAATLASTLLIAVVTSAALPDEGKVNDHFYPGYIIFLAPVWVMVALAELRRLGWRATVAACAGGGALTAVLWFVVELYTRPLRPLGRPKVFSQIDAPEVLFLVGDWDQVHLARVTATVLGMIVVVAALMATRRAAVPAVLALVAVVAFNAVAMTVITGEMHAISAAQYATGPELVRDAGIRPGEKIVSDLHELGRYNHQREVYWRPLLMIDLRSDPIPADATVVISCWRTGDPALDWDGEAHGWHLIGDDPVWHWAAWRRNS